MTDLAQLNDAAEKLAGWLEGRRYGATVVRGSGATVMRDEDGERSIYLSLVLSDPVGPEWPVEDVMALQREVVHQAGPAGITCSVYLSIQPETDAPQADDDELAYG